jgi:branched-subunit amino acid transport protein AzlD
MKNLNAKAWLALAVLAIVMGLLLFVPAGTVHYWQAWVYLSIFTGTSVLATLIQPARSSFVPLQALL